jgi:Tol biopolymer transport system component
MKKELWPLIILSSLLGCSEEVPQDTLWHSGAEEELIAFIRRGSGDKWGEIYVINPDGSNVRLQGEVATLASGDLHWSPDGEKLALIKDSKIFIMSERGVVGMPLDTHILPENLTWSPDGNYMAFQSRHEIIDEWPVVRIYMSELGTRSVVRTLPLPTTIDDRWDAEPSWSPDGTRIAFSSDRGRDGYDDIYTMRPDGSQLERLTWPPITKSRPVWSPDGTKVAFEGKGNGNGSTSIYVMNADGSGIFQVTHNLTRSNHSPTWSPDGTRLAFTSDHEGNPEIYIINIDGTGLKRLTNYPGDDFAPTWSRGKNH